MSSSAGLNRIISQCTQNNPSVHIWTSSEGWVFLVFEMMAKEEFVVKTCWWSVRLRREARGR